MTDLGGLFFMFKTDPLVHCHPHLMTFSDFVCRAADCDSISFGWCFCRHNTSALRAPPVPSMAKVHTYTLEQCGWITLRIGDNRCHFSFRFNAGDHYHQSCCCGWCWHYHSCWRRALGQCDILCLHSTFLFDRPHHIAPTSFSTFQSSVLQAELYSICP